MTQFRRRLPGMVYGGDYNPEQWPREVWQEDMRLMREAGVSLVSLGIFSWSWLETADGEYDFSWLDDIMALLADNGIAVNLATPSAAPPPWLAEKFPDSLPVDNRGVRVGVGGRGHFCPSSDAYRERSRRMAGLLAERYHEHPALAMWHIGNEYHGTCYCDQCDARFRLWLQSRYVTLDELNRRWGTAVWSQRYGDWTEVHVPRLSRGWMNPARQLDFARFTSDVLLELFTAERDLIRAATPSIPVTTNFFAFHRGVDARRWAGEVDVVAFDMYPDPAKPDSMVDAAFQFDLMRSLRGGRPWMLMEQATGAVSQWQTNTTKRPGRMRLGSLQAVAHGSDSVMFFQWRAARRGQEKFHSAMVPHGGTATRTWEEVRSLGHELPQLADVAAAQTTPDVGIVWDWPNWWAVEGVAHPVNTFDYRDTVMRHYRPLWNQHIAADVIDLDANLSRYKLVVVPNQYMMTAAQSAALVRYVDAGGHVLVSYFSGIVDEDDAVVGNAYPGALRSVVGGHVRDFSPLPAEDTVGISATAGSLLAVDMPTGAGTQWQDDMVAENAEVIAVYTDGYLAGRPAILDHELGSGRAVYVGTRLDDAALDALLTAVVRRAGVTPTADAPRGVEIVERSTSEATYLFILNHLRQDAELTLPRSGIDLLTGRHFTQGQTITLPETEAIVLRS
jgi:beta-galactosidase